MKESSGKMEFISCLRAVSCIIIMFYHLVFIFFTTKDRSIFPYIPQQDINNKVVGCVETFLCSFNFNCGGFGCGLFFLITGFVTAMSLERDCSYKYILKRFFRIYPTYIVGFGITVIAIFSWCQYTGFTFPFSIREILLHMTLFRNFMCSVYIDNGVWTLEINMFFYILMFILYNIYICKKRNRGVLCFLICLITTIYGICFYKIYMVYFVKNTMFAYILSVFGDISFF